MDPAIPFDEDYEHATYDPEAAHLFWQQLVQADRGLESSASHFTGKVGPVHFFWGAMDLACTRFSGEDAPTHPGGAPNCGDWVMAEGYSRELSSAGFWPGGGDEGAFYSYAYPEPDGFSASAPGPEGAYYSTEFRQFLLPYEVVADSDDPDADLVEFLQATYCAAADHGGWDRGSPRGRPAPVAPAQAGAADPVTCSTVGGLARTRPHQRRRTRRVTGGCAVSTLVGGANGMSTGPALPQGPHARGR